MEPSLLFVAPAHWAPVKDALVAAIPNGEDRVHSLLGGQPSYGFYGTFLDVQKERNALRGVIDAAWSGAVDLERCVAGIQPHEDIAKHLGSLNHNLGLAYTLRRLVTLLVEKHALNTVVTTCTFDLFGRTLVEACEEHDLPLIHLQHACSAIPPEDATYLRDTPGDLVLVPGEREVAWWKACSPETKVIVTGHPLWDGYASLERRVKEPDELPVVVWAAASGANDWQTPQTWATRSVPTLAWQGFLESISRLKRQVRIVLLVRQGEDPELVQRWVNELNAARLKVEPDAPQPAIAVSQVPPMEMLPEADVVIAQQSNLLVEAMTLGIPVIDVTRDGQELFSESDGLPTVKVLPYDDPGRLGEFFAGTMEAVLQFPHLTACKDVAARFNAGVDGRAMERVCQEVGQLLDAWQREKVSA